MKLIVESQLPEIDLKALPEGVAVLERLAANSLLVKATPAAAELLRQAKGMQVRVLAEASVTPPGQLLPEDFDDVEAKLAASARRRNALGL